MKKVLLFLALCFFTSCIIAQTTPDLGQVLSVDNNGYQLGIANINNIIGGTATTSSLTYKTTTGAGTTNADHIFQVGNNGATEAMRIFNNGNVSVGSFSTSSQRIFQFNQNTAFGSLGSLVGATSWGALYFNQTTPSLTNYALAGSGGTIVLNGEINGSINVNNINRLIFLGVLSSGNSVSTTILQPSNTNQTASTEIPGFKLIAGSRQWATGSIITQRENYWTAPTYTAIGASIITNAYANYFDSPIASTNITITNNYGLGIDKKMIVNASKSIDTRGLDCNGNGSTTLGHIGTFSNGLYLTNNYFYDGSQKVDDATLGGCRLLLQSATTTGSYISFGTATAGTALPTENMRLNNSGNLGIGASTTISAKIHAISTTEQLRVGYDASNYYSTTVGSTGGVTFNAVGSGSAFTFSDAVTLPTGSIGVTQSANDNSTKIATTAYVDNAVDANNIIWEAEVTIIGAEILNLNSTPKAFNLIVGSGKYVEVISASATMTFNTTAYATNTTLELICVGASVMQLQNFEFLKGTVTRNTTFTTGSAPTAGQTQLVDNADLQVRVANGNPTAGDSNIKVKILYRIVTI